MKKLRSEVLTQPKSYAFSPKHFQNQFSLLKDLWLSGRKRSPAKGVWA